MRFRFACLCSVDWDIAGPFDSDAPMLIDVHLIIDGHRKFLLWGSQMFGETMQMISQAQEEDEEEVVLSEQNVEHLGKWEVLMGVILSCVWSKETPFLHI